MKVDPNYTPYVLGLDPSGPNLTSRLLLVLARGVRMWHWVDPVRREKLPPLFVLSPDPGRADAIISWVPSLPVSPPKDEDSFPRPTLARVQFNDGLTPRVHLSLEMFVEAPTNEPRNVAHELGHLGGLAHQPAGIMADTLGVTGVEVRQDLRERVAANLVRMRNGVTPDQLLLEAAKEP